jgi:coproporphyrinogen III oxidase-like Fe-S oxidoreductase
LELGGERFATACERVPERWLERVARDGHGFVVWDEIAPSDAAREHLLMNLRLVEGLDLSDYRARWNTTPNPARIADLAEQGLVALDGTRLRVTAAGMLVLNAVIAALTD